MTMYLFNPENGNLVNRNTGKDMEYLSWEEVVKGVKKIVIGIDGNNIYAPGAENATHSFQEWLAKEHPEVELSLHSGPMRDLEVHHTYIHLEATHYGMYVAMAEVESGKTGKMVNWNHVAEGGDVQTFHITKDSFGGIAGVTKVVDIPAQPPVETEINLAAEVSSMTEEDKTKVCDGITTTIEQIIRERRERKAGIKDLLNQGQPLVDNYQGGNCASRLYMMSSTTGPATSKLVQATVVLEHLTTGIDLDGRPLRVFISFASGLDIKENKKAAKVLGEALPEVVGLRWVGVDKEQDADIGLAFDGQWWIVTKCRGSMEGIVGHRLVTQALLDEACRNVNVEEAYPKTFSAPMPEGKPAKEMNAYEVDWAEAAQGILIIVDVQKDMTEADTHLNRETLGRIVDAILSKDLAANITIKGDTDCDYETRLIQEITNAHAVVNIAGGEADIEKFRMFPDLVGANIW